jgi:hypothetical protein
MAADSGVLMARRIVSLVLGTLLSVAVIAPVMAAPTFTDVPESNVFYNDIEWLSAMEITNGCNPPTNDHYCPNNNVTRGQMAAFLVRALGLTDDGGGDHFTDDDGSIFESSIDKLYTAGITQGCNPPTNDHYCPNNNVTRGQMAAFLRRGLDTPPVQVTGVSVTTGGGSGEIAVFWNTSPELDIDHYNVWYSYVPGYTKTLVTDPYLGPEPTTGNRWWIVDWPLSLDSGYDCYQVSAVDMAGQEGPRSAEACFDAIPGAPSQVTGVTATTSGGSGEIAVYWDEVPEADVADYNVWYSESPGGAKTLIADPYYGPQPTTGSRWYIIDYPRSLTVGGDCYQISAVDLSGNEGPRSAEACFTP